MISSLLSSIYIGGIKFIDNGIMSILLYIDAKVYGLISDVYSLFLRLANAQIFKSEVYQDISSKVYIVMGVMALFVIAYSMIQFVINPDKVKDAKIGGVQVTKSLVIALVMICLVPSIFDLLYSLQKAVVTSNFIPKLLLVDDDNMVKLDDIPKTIEFRDENGNVVYTADCQATTPEEAAETCTPYTEEIEIDETDLLEKNGNQISYAVLSGFLHPADNRAPETVETNASDDFDISSGVGYAGWFCAGGVLIAGGILAVIAVTSGGTAVTPFIMGLPVVSSVKGALVAACGLGATAGLAFNTGGYLVTYDHYTWAMAAYEIEYSGDFGRITPFADRITDGTLNYIPIVSTICGLLVLYMMLSFCLDLGVRAAKLAFYEIFAPISMLMSIVPGQKDLLSKWVRVVMTTWLEVFVRIICVCSIGYLISHLNNLSFGGLGLLAKAIIVMGIVTFAKQFPKILGEITGIKSDGMKLGITDKLREGGLLTAAALVGGAATAGVRNLTHAGKNIGNQWKKDTAAGVSGGRRFWNATKGVLRGVGSSAVGTLSGGARSFKGGAGAKNWTDVKNAASKGGADAVRKRIDRETYKSEHNNNLIDVMVGHMDDAVGDVVSWATAGAIEAYQKELEKYNSIDTDAKAIKTTTDNFIQGKKFLFSFKGDKEFTLQKDDGRGGKINVIDSKGNTIHFGKKASLTEVEKVITALSNTGNIDDARYADQLNNMLNKRIKDISKAFQGVALDSNEAGNFEKDFSSSNATKSILEDGMVELAEINKQYETLRRKLKDNSNLTGVKSYLDGTTDGKTRSLEVTPAELGDLRNEVAVQISGLQAKIRDEEAAGRGKKKNS